MKIVIYLVRAPANLADLNPIEWLCNELKEFVAQSKYERTSIEKYEELLAKAGQNC